MIGPFGRQGPAATLGQHCPQMTRRPGMYLIGEPLVELVGRVEHEPLPLRALLALRHQRGVLVALEQAGHL